MTSTITTVPDQEVATAVGTPRASQPRTLEIPDARSHQEVLIRDDKMMILAMICAVAFSVGLVVFLVFPVMQTLVSPAISSWNPGP